MSPLNLIFILTLLTLTQAAQLRFYAASQSGGISSWQRGPRVTTPRFTVCPSNLPNPFTIVCTPNRGASSANFFINGQLSRREGVAPYTIAGDFNGVANPWRRQGTVTVRCDLSNGETVQSRITFSCSDEDTPTTTPPSTTRPATTPPSFTQGSGSPGSRNCVTLPALSASSRNGWDVNNGGLFFRPRGHPQSDTLDVTPAGEAVATYSFRAPVDGRYGFTLDMATSGSVDHNDVWVEFPAGGFTLTRGNSRRNANGWTKAYHNRNGRSNQVFSVDFDPHTFSTRRSLTAGRRYTVRVSGRSTRTGFFSIVMFPCSGAQCDGTSSSNNYWRATRDACD